MGLYIKSAFWLLLLDFSSKVHQNVFGGLAPHRPTGEAIYLGLGSAGNGREKREEVAVFLA